VDWLHPETRAWLEASFETPTPVQRQGWPRIAAGHHTLLLAPTGSGKTLAAFLYWIDRLSSPRPTENADPAKGDVLRNRTNVPLLPQAPDARSFRGAAPSRGHGSGARASGSGVRVLYVSPLKALVYDIERNLRAPLAGVARLGAPGEGGLRVPRVAVRTGDTPERERRSQARDPAEILVTTPESLYLILGSAQRETLRTVEAVIVDEIHALAPTKRGAHLALSLERVAALVEAAGGADPQRIGLSATARPVEEVARFLGGDREVAVVDARARPALDLRISVPVPDMTRPGDGYATGSRDGSAGDRLPATAAPPDAGETTAPSAPGGTSSTPAPRTAVPGATALGTATPGAAAPQPRRPRSILGDLLARESPPPTASLWPALHPVLLEAIRAHRTSLVFVNSRGLCERLAQRLNELAGEELVRAHHGSVAHARRREIEEELKAGRLRAIVATSSLELGIDMGAVDLVAMVESPGGVARGLQRVGRAGHRVGEVSRGLVLPKHRGDLLEATVVAEAMAAGEVEPLRVPRNPLDVLAQQIVALCATEPWRVEDLERRVRRAAPYRELSPEALRGVLDMLAGRYPSAEFGELRPRLVWDREADRLEARRGAGRLALVSGGTIPDRGLYAVHLGPDGPRIGELDEEMVHETRPGQTVTLGASTWRVVEITRDRVVVAPAPGEPGRLPFWRGEGPGRPVELGRAVGRFVRELAGRALGAGAGTQARAGERAASEAYAAAEAWLRERYRLDAFAARNLIDYLREQHDATGCLPTDRAITIERFRDELGDWRVCILSPFGARVHAPWALAIESQLSAAAGWEVQALWSDDGIVLRLADAEALPERDLLVPDPDDVTDRVVEQLAHSPLFAGQFRENAARALLLPRRRPGARTPLWAQRLRAQNLLAVARRYPAFPILLETYRSCLQDVFDLPALVDLLRAVRRREVRIDEVETRQASPFARSLVFAYTAAYLYRGDAPVAERRAQALTLDRQMLRDLLGEEDLRDLLDADVIDQVTAELQGRDPEHRARHPDALHDLLRRVGDLAEAELAERCEADREEVAAWLDALEASRRAARLRLAGEERWVAAEDVALYRDALGAVPPPGLPAALLEEAEAPLEQLAARFARRRGPFATRAFAARYGLLPAQVEPVLKTLEAEGRLLAGGFHPHGAEPEWCEPEVLRRLRRGTLARLRREVAPVEATALARFLPGWQGVQGDGAEAFRASGAGADAGAEGALDAALAQLEGLPLSFAELEQSILPARVPGYEPRMLDERGALGRWVWIGRGSLGDRDGRVALYRRDRAALLADPSEVPDDLPPLHRAVLDHLERRGASFADEIAAALRSAPSARRSESGAPHAAAAGAGRAKVGTEHAGSDAAGSAELLRALWDLAWQGLVTNDTFAPLRALGTRPPGRRPRSGRAARRGAGGAELAGRWSLVGPLLAAEIAPTERAHARALLLLERYGVVSREVAAIETLPGCFAGIYPVLRAMEEAGQARRGHFVEGLSGAQFASAGAVDRLRRARIPSDEPEVHVLAASDPACPFGFLLPWPETRHPAARPRRAAGCRVAVVEGEAVLFLERRARRIWSFAPLAPEGAEERLARAVAALPRALFSERRRRTLRVEQIDGEPAARSPWAELFAGAGFRPGYRGLELDRHAARSAARPLRGEPARPAQLGPPAGVPTQRHG